MQITPDSEKKLIENLKRVTSFTGCFFGLEMPRLRTSLKMLMDRELDVEANKKELLF